MDSLATANTPTGGSPETGLIYGNQDLTFCGSSDFIEPLSAQVSSNIIITKTVM